MSTFKIGDMARIGSVIGRINHIGDGFIEVKTPYGAIIRTGFAWVRGIQYGSDEYNVLMFNEESANKKVSAECPRHFEFCGKVALSPQAL